MGTEANNTQPIQKSVAEDEIHATMMMSINRSGTGTALQIRTDQRTQHTIGGKLPKKASFNPSITKSAISTLRNTTTHVFGERKDVDTVIAAANDPVVHSKIKTRSEDFNDNEFESVDNIYERGRVFAEGGQATICEAKDNELGRIVAIKSMKQEFLSNTEQRNAFVREARITAQLDHPAVIPIYSLNTDEEHDLHLAMKLVKGKSFKHYLEEICSQYKISGIEAFDERKSLLNRIDVLLRVCDALEYAHSRNIMHCDLKPENIMIGEYREVYVMDWGIAHLIHDPDAGEWVAPDKISGTPRFLSPEAIAGLCPDQRADVFTMGLILFEAVTLTEAYVGESCDDVLSKILNGEMAPLYHKYGYHIDTDLCAIIEKATETDREQRYQSIAELASDLRRYIEGKEVSANPDNLLRKSARFAMRHHRLLLTTMLLLFLIGTSGAAWTLFREIRVITTQNQRETAIGYAHTLSSMTAENMETILTRQEQALSALVEEYLLLDGSEMNPDVPPRYLTVHQLQDPKTKPDSLQFSPAHCRPIDFDHLAVMAGPGIDLQNDKATIRHLNVASLMYPHLYQAVLNSAEAERLPASKMKDQEKIAREKGVPLHLILFGFSDGTYFVYPGNPEYKDDYDPRTRHWYMSSEQSKAGELRWSKPYLAIHRAVGYLISCGMPMIDQKGRFHGVTAIDVSLPILIENLKKTGNQGNYVLGKYLIDEKDDIMVCTDPADREKMESSGNTVLLWPKFKYPEITARARRFQFGSYIRSEKSIGEVFYCYMKLHNGWLYVERIDLKKLINAQKKKKTSAILPASSSASAVSTLPKPQ